MATEDTRGENRLQPQRRWPRYSCRVPVRILVGKGTETAVIRAVATELNEGGFALYTWGELGIRDQLQIEFEPFAWDRPIKVKGVVCHRREHIYGVAFLPMSPKQRGDLFLMRQTMRNAAVEYWDS